MGRMTGHRPSKILLAAAALALSAPVAASAQTFGGFDTDIPDKATSKKIVQQQIVDVRTDQSWNGPKSIEAALRLVKPGGTIVVHPGEYYQASAIGLDKSVTIRGLRNGDQLPVIRAANGCFSVRSDQVSALITDLAFETSSHGCIAVSQGNLELHGSQIYASGYNPNYGPGANIPPRAVPFNRTSLDTTDAALVSIEGGRVTLADNIIMGGENGVLIRPAGHSNGFEHFTLRNNEITRSRNSGVILVGNVDANLDNNSVAMNGMGGIYLSGTGHTRMIGNNISSNGNQGLYVDSLGEYVTVSNNTISNNSRHGVEVRRGMLIFAGNEVNGHEGCAVVENPYRNAGGRHVRATENVDYTGRGGNERSDGIMIIEDPNSMREYKNRCGRKRGRRS